MEKINDFIKRWRMNFIERNRVSEVSQWWNEVVERDKIVEEVSKKRGLGKMDPS
jgi:hypothetical protein